MSTHPVERVCDGGAPLLVEDERGENDEPVRRDLREDVTARSKKHKNESRQGRDTEVM